MQAVCSSGKALSLSGRQSASTANAARQPRTFQPAITRTAQRGQRCTKESTRLGAAVDRATGDNSSSFGEEEDLEAKLEEFMRKQAEKESGLVAVPAVKQETVVGDNLVPDDEAKRFCREIVRVLKVLQEKREMTMNEIKLVLAIEDPRARDQRLTMGLEEESGASRDEIAAALLDVIDGRIPRDRVALRELHREMVNWPYLEQEDQLPDDEGSNPYEKITETGGSVARPPQLKRDPTEKPQGFADSLPDWVGYTFLYGVSAVPVFIVVAVVAILFVNSLK